MSNPLTLKVVGERTIHCGGCESSVQFTLSQLPGVRDVKADRHTQRIELTLVGEQTSLQDVQAELDMLGYQVVAA